MILLRNFEYANRYFNYQSKTEHEGIPNRICGWYKSINGIVSALVVTENSLYFVHEDNKFLITDTHNALIKANGEFDKEFVLYDGKNKISSFFYSVPQLNLNIPPFEYIDEDDFKWGDFIRKIINDPIRKQNFISNLMYPDI